jgi:hypothetical protein
MAHYLVRYYDEGTDVAVDARYLRVQLFRDGVYVGLYAGLVYGNQMQTASPQRLGDEMPKFWTATALVLADYIYQDVMNGQAPQQWSPEVRTIPIPGEYIRARADQPTTPILPINDMPQWPVVEFDA